MFTADQYREQLLALLPPGRLFNRSPGSVIWSLADAFAQELARLEARAYELLDESDPRTTSDLLSAWEAVAGLPDECHGLATTEQGRRLEVTARITASGSLSRQFYIDLAASLGFAITIDEFDPSNPGPGGLGYAGDDWYFVWRINAPAENTVVVFKVGLSKAGEKLREWGNTAFECVIDRVKPAHTRVIHAYV